MMSCIFEPLLGRTMEAYIDDMLVKLKSREDHITHLRDAFWLMRLHRLWWNLDKCAFRVGFGNFIRFLINQRGIEMPPEKAKVIGQLQPPHNQDADTNSHRQISSPQQVYLQIFGSLQPFFIELKGASLNGWGLECDNAFHFIKEYIASPLLYLRLLMVRNSTCIWLPQLWP